MSDAPELSRRDWFRLRLPHQTPPAVATPALGENANADSPGELKAIEHPPNHDGMDLRDLPPLREAMLGVGDVKSLLKDIQTHGADVQLMQKRAAPNARANVDASSSLNAAGELFLSGTVKRLQIRYRWQNALWIDTLAQQPDGIRLVRVSHQSL